MYLYIHLHGISAMPLRPRAIAPSIVPRTIASSCAIAGVSAGERMYLMVLRTATAAVLLALSVFAQAASTIVLDAVMDTSIYSEGLALADGAGPHLWIGQINGGSNRRAFVRFDLSAVPAGSVVVAARLHINMSRTISAGHVIEARRLLASWGEGTSFGGGSGAGATASAGDATWGFRFFGARTPWTTPGSDFVSGAPSASTLVGFAGGRYTWSGDGLVADVQRWLTSPAENFGWILIGDETERSAMRFDSRNGPAGPVLELDVVPGSANVPIPIPWLVVAGLLLLGSVFRAHR